MINEPNPTHTLLSELFTHHRGPEIRVQNSNELLMIEKLQIENHSLLKTL